MKLTLKLKKQIEKHKMLLAQKLGYKGTETITRWLQRGSVPSHQFARVKAIIEGRE